MIIIPPMKTPPLPTEIKVIRESMSVTRYTHQSQSEIIVGEGFIRAIDRIGPIPIRRKRPIAALRQLVVRKGGLTVTGQNGVKQTYAPDLASLEAVTDTGKPMWMAPAYPHELLRPLADVLAASLSLSGIEVNDRPVMEIQIIPKSGKKIGLLSNRSSEEKAWLAYVLRQTLKAGNGK